MARIAIAICLVLLFAGYSVLIYTKGTQEDILLSKEQQELVTKGKTLFQKFNCQSCHQIYGLGGYLGPDLTTAYSDKHRGEGLMKAVLQSGGNRMPDFGLSNDEIDHLIAYLRYVDSTATPLKTGTR